jgi:hypothetical protein
MRNRLLKNANEDLPVYLDSFKKFWEDSCGEMSEGVLIECYHSTIIFKNWKLALNHIGIAQLDQILNEIYEDINSSFYLSLLGLYRSAHMHLRSSIELSFQLLYFLHHPIELEKWFNGKFIMKHEKLVEYLSTHPSFPSSEKSLIDDISLSWKHFSKHIHAEAPIYFQSEKGSTKTKEFSREDFGKWESNFTKITYRLNLLFCLFFSKEFKNFPTSNRDIILGYLKERDINKLGLN